MCGAYIFPLVQRYYLRPLKSVRESEYRWRKTTLFDFFKNVLHGFEIDMTERLLHTHYFEAVINAFQFFFLKRGHQIAFICSFFSLPSSYKLQFEREYGTKWCKNSSIRFISAIIKRHKKKFSNGESGRTSEAEFVSVWERKRQTKKKWT